MNTSETVVYITAENSAQYASLVKITPYKWRRLYLVEVPNG